MSRRSLNYFRNVHQQFEEKLTDTVCSLIAPGQEDKMKRILAKENRSESDDSILVHLKNAFEICCTRKARLSILMLVPKLYSKSEICDTFQCSHYEIATARRILKTYGPCAEEPQNERVYSRLSFEKAQHFIDFLFSTGLLQEVAYGTVKLKFDSGDTITVSNTILNGIYEHSIKEYLIYCKEIKYDSLGATTLRKMLHKMKPRIRKKLAGVDSFIVEGVEAFEVGTYWIYRILLWKYSFLLISILTDIERMSETVWFWK